MRSNPAYTAAAVEMPTAGAGNNTNTLTVSYGDFIFQGSANEDTVEAFREALRENTKYIQGLVFNDAGIKTIQKRTMIANSSLNSIGTMLHDWRGTMR